MVGCCVGCSHEGKVQQLGAGEAKTGAQMAREAPVQAQDSRHWARVRGPHDRQHTVIRRTATGFHPPPRALKKWVCSGNKVCSG